MTFDSWSFLALFLVPALAAYHAVPGRTAKNVVLLLASLAFYTWGEPMLVPLFVVYILVAWLCGRLMDRTTSERAANGLLAGGVVLLLAPLAGLRGLALVAPDAAPAMPLGLSFYALQAVSYLADVRSGATEPEENPFYVALYLAFFPQVVMGPIVRHPDVRAQLRERTETLSGTVAGMRLFVVGLAKKALLSDTIAGLFGVLTSYDAATAGAVGAWTAVVCFAFQLYFDFSGYSDMALGLAQMFGFRLRMNFCYPFLSKSTSEFWRRWHISLGSFFRDYVYIPLGGSRVSGPLLVRNLAVVWVLTGLWHGGTVLYVLWGIWAFALILAERALGERLVRVPAVLRVLATFLLMALGMLAFWLRDLPQLCSWLAALGGAYGATGTRTFWQLDVWAYWLPFLGCIVASTPLVPWLRARLVAWACDEDPEPVAQVPPHDGAPEAPQCDVDRWLAHVREAAPASRARVVSAVFLAADVALVCLLVLSLAAVMLGAYHPSLYARF